MSNLKYDKRGIVARTFDESAYVKKSPFVEGFITGAKAALIGAPVGAAFQVMQGKSAVPGAILGALMPGIAAGAVAAAEQKLRNLDDESIIRYHTEKIKEREPMFFMPPRPYADRRRNNVR